MGTTAIVILSVIAILAIWFMVIYNGLVALKNRFKNAFAQIDVQLKRRYDLIPNLVDTAKRYMAHEADTLEAVIKARNSAQAANQNAAADPASGIAIEELVGAESALTGALGKLFALSENYPDLKANQTMEKLMEELSSTENRVSFARQAFNDSVMAYNTKIESVPDNLVAGMFNFTPAALWHVEEAAEKEAIKVNF